MSRRIRPAHREELAALATFIAQQNRVPETQCMHLGEDPDGVLRELHAYTDAPETRILVVHADDAPGAPLLGLIGEEHDADDRHVWLWGPHVDAADLRLWHDTAAALYDALVPRIPFRPTKTDAFIHEANTRAVELLLSRGFSDTGVVHVYVADRSTANTSSATGDGTGCRDLSDDDIRAFTALHAAAFPDSWCSAEAALARRASGDRILVHRAPDEKAIAGYVLAGIGEDGTEGFIHFLAVDAAHRGRGIGHRLLQSALAWLFGTVDVPRVGLTVRDGLADARALYERAGFRLDVSGRALRAIGDGTVAKESA